jgi:predicted ribonuclease YlaK
VGGRALKECATVTLTKVERSVLAAVASNIFNSPEARR